MTLSKLGKSEINLGKSLRRVEEQNKSVYLLQKVNRDLIFEK